MAVNSERITNLLSMAQRARRIVSGAFAVQQAAQKKQAVLLLVATDAAAETKNNCQAMAEKYGIPYTEVLDRERLGSCLGKEYRAMAALTDAGFARKLSELLEEKHMS